MNRFAIILLLFLTAFTGCTSTPHDLIQANADVNAVTMPQVHQHAADLEDHYWDYAQHNGITWPPRRSDVNLVNPDIHGNGGDTALFTGYMLAAQVYKWKVTGDAADFTKVLQTLRGCYILTHATGTPGVISRCAFDTTMPERFGFPEFWGSRIDRGFVGEGPAETGSNWVTTYTPMTYYTRATRDQITGLIFGLSTAWKELDGNSTNEVLAREVIAKITADVYWYLRANDFLIRDQHGRNDTSADDVTGVLKLALLGLFRHTSGLPRIQEKYEELFAQTFILDRAWDAAINVFNNWDQYYAWNLRYARACSIWLLEDDAERRATVVDYVRSKLWAYTRNHNSPQFAFIYAAMRAEGEVPLTDALFGLKSLSLRPMRQWDSPLCGDLRAPNLSQALTGIGRYIVPPHLRKPTDYSTWTKKPWDTGEHCLGDALPNGDNTGGDFLLPYWMGRRYGFIE